MNTDIKMHPAFIKLLQQYPEITDLVKTRQLEERNKVENKNITTSRIVVSEDEKELDDVKAEHSAEPLKDLNDIKRIRDYYLSKKQYRNHMLFLVGINVGLRVSDLIKLKFGHFIDIEGNFRENIIVTEKKTGKERKIAIGNVAKDAINLYLKHNPSVTRGTYMFRNKSNNGLIGKEEVEIKDIEGINNYKTKIDKNGKIHYYILKEADHMTRQGVQYILNKTFDDLQLPQRHGTHMMRQTFGYHIAIEGDTFERARNLEKLQMLFGHSSPAITLRYIGLTDDEIYATYTSRNYGLSLVDTKLV